MDYATLPLAEIRTGLENVARDVEETFGSLDGRQLNWRPDAAQWSVAQCFEHLLASNHMMSQAGEDALSGRAPKTIWHRLPFWSRMFGPLIVRSQAPEATRKYKTSPQAMPASSDISADVIQRFIEQNHQLITRLRTLDEQAAASVIMTSPFATFVSYSVLDGCRLLFTHDRRHIEQARRVMQSAGFPVSRPVR
jgi:DinB family protein